ncbi:MAG: tRNA (adenosine(37)-N6)-threonylcarbamoyltransferase complex ATPase subunit type 1 TsaE [Desulfatibacillaceae bacterium]
MEPAYTIRLVLDSPEKTRALGRALGAVAWPGMVLALCGDLGGGKTCLAQGLARGLGVPEDVPVTSPTYTLINEYQGRLPLFHADLYRLEGEDDLDQIGFFECLEAGGVAAVEWADRVGPSVVPADLEIRFTALNEDAREAEACIHGPRADTLADVLRPFSGP